MSRGTIGTGPSERPRDRLLKRGPGALSDAELLAILLFGGCGGYDVLDEVEQLLLEDGGLLGVSQVDPDELRARPGISAAKAAAFAAAVELGRRIGSSESANQHLGNPLDVCRYLERLLQQERREKFGLLCLDVRHRLIRQHWSETETEASGSEASGWEYCWFRDGTVDDRGLVKQVLFDDAPYLLVLRYQPSANVSMKPADRALASRLFSACERVCIVMLDYFVIGIGRSISLRLEDPTVFELPANSGWGTG